MVPLWNDFVMHQILDLRLQSLIVTRVTKTIAGSHEQKGGSGHVFHVTQWSGGLWERRELITVYVGLFVLGAMYWLLRLFDLKSTTRTKNFIKIVLIEAATVSDEIYFYAVQIFRTANLRIRSTSLAPYRTAVLCLVMLVSFPMEEGRTFSDKTEKNGWLGE